MQLQNDHIHPLTHAFPDCVDVPWRIREIAMLRGLGYSFREIAAPLGVTPQAVSLMLSRHRRSIKSLCDAMEMRNLSPRAVNALARHGIVTRDEARCRDAVSLVKNARNCGSKTIEEIRIWIDGDPTRVPAMSSTRDE